MDGVRYAAGPLLLTAVAVLFALLAIRSDRAERARGAAPGSVERAGAAPSRAVPGTDEGEEAPATARSPAIVRGVVMGQHGGLWGARVLALEEGSGRVLAETGSGPEGDFELTLPEAPVTFDLRSEPDPETGLGPTERRGLSASPGEELEVDLGLPRMPSVEGHLTDEAGHDLAGVTLFAVRPEDGADAPAYVAPTLLLPAAVARTTTMRDGRFCLRNLPARPCRLLVQSPQLALREPVFLDPAGHPALELVAVPAASFDYEILDLETGLAVSAFHVVLGDAPPGGPIPADAVRVEGSDGRLARRVPGRWRVLAIEANGYETVRRWGGAEGTQRARIWMRPPRARNTRLRIQFRDGRTYVGVVRLVYEGDRGRAGFQRAEGPQDGVYRAALPYGGWTLTVHVDDLLVPVARKFEIVLGTGLEVDEEIVLAGGSLLLRGASGALRIRSCPGESPVVDSTPFLAERVDGIPPGRYQVLRQEDGLWTVVREVAVADGCTETVDLP